MRELLAVGAAERLSGRARAEFLAQPDAWSRWVAQRATDAGAVLRLRSASGAAVALRGDVRKISNGASCGVCVNASDEAHWLRGLRHLPAALQAALALEPQVIAWAEQFAKFYPNAKIQIEGKGSSTAPPALIEVNIGTADAPLIVPTAFYAVVSIAVIDLYGHELEAPL